MFRSHTRNSDTALPPVYPIANGGTGAERAEDAAINLRAVLRSHLDRSNGVAVSSITNTVKNSDLPEPMSLRPTLEADTLEVAPGDKLTFKITNFDSKTTYTVSATSGSASLVSDSVIYTAPNTVGKDTLKVNNREVTLTIRTTAASTIINPPTIISPANNAVGISSTPTITASQFTLSKGSDTHGQSNWQISTDSGFANIIKELTDSTNKTTLSATGLSLSTDYYVRVRYISTLGIISDWSSVVKFSTGATSSVINTPNVDSPANGSSNTAITATITSSAYSATGAETHMASSWQLALDAGFSTIVAEVNNSTANKLSWAPAGRVIDKTYYVRVMHHGSAGTASAWSSIAVFNTNLATGSIIAPTVVAPSNGATGVLKPVTITSSAFTATSGTDTHQSTVFEVATNSNFTNSTLYNSGAAGVTLTSLTLSTLVDGATYYVRVKYTGAALGTSNFGATSSFTVKAVLTITKPYVNIPGGGGITIGGGSGVYVGTSATFTCSTFAVTGGTDTHASTDWQVSTNTSFSIVVPGLTATTGKTSAYMSGFVQDTTYYIRCRHVGASGTTSEWGDTKVFKGGTGGGTTPNSTTPSITYPSNGATNVPVNLTLTSSPFSSSNGSTHLNSSWQLSLSSVFSSINQQSPGSTTNLTSWTPSTLLPNTTYYAQVLHAATKDGVNTGSGWSPTISFTTGSGGSINTPSVTPSSGVLDAGSGVWTGVSSAPSFTTSAFGTATGADTHVSTSWEIVTASGTAVASSTDDTVNKTSWTPPALTANTTYRIRVRFKGTTNGYSAWSTQITFATVAVANYTVNTPSITYPANGATGIPANMTVTLSTYGVSAGNAAHTHTTWEVSTTADFSSVAWSSGKQSANLTSWYFTGLNPGGTYYMRVRYHSSDKDSAWSNVTSFTIYAAGGTVARPSIIYLAGSTVVGSGDFTGAPTSLGFVSSAFAMASGTDTHLNSSWVLSKDPNFTTNVALTMGDTVNKTSWSVSGLEENTDYYVVVAYKGVNSPGTDWSPRVHFKTGGSAPNIGTPTISSKTVQNPGANSNYVADQVDFSFNVGIPNADGAVCVRIEYKVVEPADNNLSFASGSPYTKSGTYYSGNVELVQGNIGSNGRRAVSSSTVLVRCIFSKNGVEYASPAAKL